MKKAVIAIIILLVCAGGIFALYKYLDQQHKNSNTSTTGQEKWQVEEFGKLNIAGMTIDNDSLLTEALEALLTQKIQDKKLDGSIDLTISNTVADLEDLTCILIRITNGDISLQDSLHAVNEKGAHEVHGTLKIASANLDSTKQAEEILDFLKDLYKKEDLKVSINPQFGEDSEEWEEISIK